MTDQPLLIVAGPTASGKTHRSLALARQTHGAIISADSRMVYRGLDIGTGKPTWEYRELATSPWRRSQSSAIGPVYTIDGIDHYLIDLVEPETPFSLSNWLVFARQAIERIRAAGKQPIVTGGTGLYLKALVAGYQPPPTNFLIRSAIEAMPTESILAELHQSDPITAAREVKNRRRLVRALEVVRLTGQAMAAQRMGESYPYELEVVNLPRAELFARINERIDGRLKAGMVHEVRHLIQRGISPDWLWSLGLEYRIITDWLTEQRPDEAVLRTRLQQAIHAYARRQETFLRTQFGR